jgi:hypothetical protein
MQIDGLSRPQRVWLRRLYKEGGAFSFGNRTLYSLERAGLVTSRLVNDGISRAWSLTDKGREHFERHANPSPA